MQLRLSKNDNLEAVVGYGRSDRRQSSLLFALSLITIVSLSLASSRSTQDTLHWTTYNTRSFRHSLRNWCVSETTFLYSKINRRIVKLPTDFMWIWSWYLHRWHSQRAEKPWTFNRCWPHPISRWYLIEAKLDALCQTSRYWKQSRVFGLYKATKPQILDHDLYSGEVHRHYCPEIWRGARHA